MPKPSYENINYSLRPAKCVERKMLADLLRRLDRAAPLRDYRYVGFGSPFFVDFDLFHRQLDIQEMVSVEREIRHETRFAFNRPFGAIDLRFGESTEVLPTLGWTALTIVWLDYDGPLDTAILSDIDICISQIRPGSVFIVSVSAQLSTDPDERFQDIQNNLEDYLPAYVTKDDLGGWDIANLYRFVVDEKIRTSLRARNTGSPKDAVAQYSQLVNFQYADGAKMMTVGGIILDSSTTAAYENCNFDDFLFYRDSDDAYRIDVPRLTMKEIRYLDTLLPSDDAINASDVGIPVGQSLKYAELYRYFPRYVDIEGLG